MNQSYDRAVLKGGDTLAAICDVLPHLTLNRADVVSYHHTRAHFGEDAGARAAIGRDAFGNQGGALL